MLEVLPERLAHALRVASVPAHLRALLDRLPVPLAVTAELPDTPEAVPASVRQLLKAATLGTALQLVAVSVAGPGARPRLRITQGERVFDTDPSAAPHDAGSLVLSVLELLLDARQLGEAMTQLARQTASLEALYTLTHEMLLADTIDEALEAMLAGITAGHGLAFNRAALFVRGDDGTFVGAKGMGPADEGEAHRIWEELELGGASLAKIVARDAQRDRRFEALVRTLSLRPTDHPDDEIAAAARADHPLRIAADRPISPGLQALRASRELVLAPVRARGELRALLFADNLYGRAPILAPQVELLGYFLEHGALVWDNLALRRRVEELARSDALTGLSNRRVFEERLGEELSRAQREGTALTVVVLDVDRFKEVNDTRGHGAGDETLRALGALLREGARAHEVVARIGGDEFALVLPGADASTAVAAALRFGRAASARGVSLSVGVASFPGDCPSPDALLSTADARVYAAKRGGRARVVADAGRELPF